MLNLLNPAAPAPSVDGMPAKTASAADAASAGEAFTLVFAGMPLAGPETGQGGLPPKAAAGTSAASEPALPIGDLAAARKPQGTLTSGPAMAAALENHEGPPRMPGVPASLVSKGKTVPAGTEASTVPKQPIGSLLSAPQPQSPVKPQELPADAQRLLSEETPTGTGKDMSAGKTNPLLAADTGAPPQPAAKPLSPVETAAPASQPASLSTETGALASAGRMPAAAEIADRSSPASPAEQLRAAVATRADGKTIEVRLDPPELGRVQMELEVGRNGALKAVVTASDPDVLDLLRRNAGTLLDDLKADGFNDVELEWQGGSEANDNHHRPQLPFGLPEGPAGPNAPGLHAGAVLSDGSLDIKL